MYVTYIVIFDIAQRGKLVHKLRDVLGYSSRTMSGEQHSRRRAVLHERLSRGVVNSYVGEMSAAIRATHLQLSKHPTFRADLVGGSLALKLVCIALLGHRVLTVGDKLAVIEAVYTLEAYLQGKMFRFCLVGLGENEATCALERTGAPPIQIEIEVRGHEKSALTIGQ